MISFIKKYFPFLIDKHMFISEDYSRKIINKLNKKKEFAKNIYSTFEISIVIQRHEMWIFENKQKEAISFYQNNNLKIGLPKNSSINEYRKKMAFLMKKQRIKNINNKLKSF